MSRTGCATCRRTDGRRASPSAGSTRSAGPPVLRIGHLDDAPEPVEITPSWAASGSASSCPEEKVPPQQLACHARLCALRWVAVERSTPATRPPDRRGGVSRSSLGGPTGTRAEPQSLSRHHSRERGRPAWSLPELGSAVGDRPGDGNRRAEVALHEVHRAAESAARRPASRRDASRPNDARQR